MNNRLIIIVLITFPIMLLGNHYWIGRSWLSSLAGTILFEFVILSSNYLFLKRRSKKAAEQNKG